VVARPKRSEAERLGLKKLSESNIDAEYARKNGIRFLDTAQTQRVIGHSVISIELPYYGLDGKQRKDIKRYRLLSKPKPGAFGAIKTLPKYLQTPGSPPAAYFPLAYDWQDIAQDIEQSIWITEGEIKALCAARFDDTAPTIGLGGVSSWRSKKQGWGFLPELEKINWAGRVVRIIYDSDARANPDVAKAAAGLMRALVDRGAQPTILYLPDVLPNGKTGLDDYLVAMGPSALEVELAKLRCDELSQALHGFNARYAFILDTGVVLDTIEDNRWEASKFRTAIVANQWAHERIEGDRGSQLKRRKVGDAWIEWPTRREYRALTYLPGGEPVIEGKLNGWRGWGCEPIKGDVSPWRDLLSFLFSGELDEARRWFECWCLYPLAHPGTKLTTACGLWGYEQGVGKSLVGVILGKVHGEDNFSLITQDELESPNNDWAANRTLAVIDDVSSFDSRSKADKLKSMITRDTIRVNTKYIPQYDLPDYCNMYLTSNHANAFYMEDRDRRMFVHEVTAAKERKAFYNRLWSWCANGGPSALLYYALHYDFGDWDPKGNALSTASKTEMQLHGKSELELWVHDLKEQPESKLSLFKSKDGMPLTRDAYTAAELCEIYDLTRKGPPVASSTMGLKLRASFSNPIVLSVGPTKERFYVVRNGRKWRSSTRKQLTRHIYDARLKERGGKY